MLPCKIDVNILFGGPFLLSDFGKVRIPIRSMPACIRRSYNGNEIPNQHCRTKHNEKYLTQGSLE
jgi:hypothetical protein